ncbi:MAG: hypothetical protein A2289_11655 [Deltaproteobacteria bacterium RIFOXYA12_FULL_58_15]|nr:MAG: hypothetical protein A2289_11655 [Deltaproteobacteria bacterium RIFOXYA12_FULL_58_15]
MAEPRRRYDTVELVTELKRERRNALILSLAGVGILLILLLLYMTAIGEDEVPTVNQGTATSAPLQPAPNPTEPATPTEAAAPEVSPPVVKAAPATVIILLTKKEEVWVDGKSLGKIKKDTIELSADQEHEIRVKMGKKMVTKTLIPKAGETWDLRFDAKRKKAKLKKLKESSR